jgi:hypothetical protein
MDTVLYRFLDLCSSIFSTVYNYSCFFDIKLTPTGGLLIVLVSFLSIASLSAYACYLSLVFKRLVLEPMLDEEANALAGAED